MDLIYYYPWRNDAPSTVAKKVFKHMLMREKDLPFESVKLFVSAKYVREVQEQFGNLEVITYRNLNKASKNCMIHIHHPLIVFPNAKFLLYLFAVFKKKKLILRVPGEIRTEMPLKFKYEHSLNIFQVPTYIAMPYLLKSADKIIVHSYFMSKLVKSKYGVKDIVVIPNGIDDFWFDENNITNIDLDGNPNLFYHGRLSPEKGVDLLIKGLSEAIGKHSTAKLYLAADGPQRRYLENLCRKLGIGKNVIFLGHIEQKDIKTYLSNVDATIYPSRFDAFSLAILEAMGSANCPVYFSKQAGISDFGVQENYNLNAFEPTVENISEIIKEIVEGNYDSQVVRQQKEFARRYTWDKVIDEYIKFYNSTY